jgi:hypothetical protein
MPAGNAVLQFSQRGFMTIQAKPVTAEELLAMPDDGFRYELSSGELKKAGATRRGAWPPCPGYRNIP